ncbi:MAG: NAD-dependent epimerase/dehydratase family protein [Burkholderiales bacterium]|nr:NAD-dependent epimerase/dehydratase family protein [Burkholderiales bacterium]
MRVLVTGANGFIGRNLLLRLRELEGINVMTYVRGQGIKELNGFLAQADLVFHLAAENRPLDIQAFEDVNVGLTEHICHSIQASGKRTPLVFTSSTQAVLDNPYGRSKLAAEQVLQAFELEHGSPLTIYRLPGVFGKWCKPNHNSVVATFCYNKARELPVQINDENAKVELVYVDDVITHMISVLASNTKCLLWPYIRPNYCVTLGELSRQIDAFKNCRSTLITERVGEGFIRALYATYVSYLPIDRFSYDLPVHRDARGVFVEILKTPDTGQFSFFTAKPGVTRGGHYHHTKTEKFLVIKGQARFGFRNMITNEVHHLETHGYQPQIVETVPGWTHDITNIGTDEMVVMLWANEVFDRANPDTFASQV